MGVDSLWFSGFRGWAGYGRFIVLLLRMFEILYNKYSNKVPLKNQYEGLILVKDIYDLYIEHYKTLLRQFIENLPKY